jgi:hypothetical protein
MQLRCHRFLRRGGGEPDFEDGLLDVTVLAVNEEGNNVSVDLDTLMALWDDEATTSGEFPGIQPFPRENHQDTRQTQRKNWSSMENSSKRKHLSISR